ncbi:MAG: hypothetical protein K2H64_07095 [Desulfovibrio sp.]|nr:hypothetical protein [Desulfovibrio sp.]
MEILAKFPQLLEFGASLNQMLFETINKKIGYDNDRFTKYHETILQELKNDKESRETIFDFMIKFQPNFNNYISNPDLSSEARKQYYDY